jgi:HlyD family secretion protein
VLAAVSLASQTGCFPAPHTPAQAAAGTLPTGAPPQQQEASGAIRIAGLIRAVRVSAILSPQVAIVSQGGSNRLTLVTIAPNGARVKKDDVLAEFDTTRQQEETLEVEAKADDLSHQVAQRAAQNLAEAEKRLSEIKQAEADLAKARIQLKKGPVLPEILRQQNEIKAEAATARVASLTKSHSARQRSEAAALRVIELQRDRQQVMLERSKNNASKLVIKAPLAGMVALENIWKGGTMGHPREGDQLWPGQPLLKIFDPSEMFLDAQVGEPDGARLKPGTRAKVQLDAYPGLAFEALYESGSPVATTAIGSPVKNFHTRFRLLSTDPRLLPDLSAAAMVNP